MVWVFGWVREGEDLNYPPTLIIVHMTYASIWAIFQKQKLANGAALCVFRLFL
jgi:hypothetical protein